MDRAANVASSPPQFSWSQAILTITVLDRCGFHICQNCPSSIEKNLAAA